MRLQRTLTSALVPALFALGACVPAGGDTRARAGRPVRLARAAAPRAPTGAAGTSGAAGTRAPPGRATRARRALRARRHGRRARPAPRALPEASAQAPRARTGAAGATGRRGHRGRAAGRGGPGGARAQRRTRRSGRRRGRSRRTRRHGRRAGTAGSGRTGPSEREPPGRRGLLATTPTSRSSVGDDCTVATPTNVSVTTLPDLFANFDGTRMSKKSDWKCRRAELKKIVETYIHGAKPAQTHDGDRLGDQHPDQGARGSTPARPSTSWRRSAMPSGTSGPVPAVIGLGATSLDSAI